MLYVRWAQILAPLGQVQSEDGRDDQGAWWPTIAKNQWFVEVQWYLSTSDDQARKSYKLLPEIAHVPVGALVQEHGLSWEREGRGPSGESILSNASHLALMSHNYSNVE